MLEKYRKNPLSHSILNYFFSFLTYNQTHSDISHHLKPFFKINILREQQINLKSPPMAF
ncbi:MAG: hypothetical protein H6R05_1515 [Burkholderiaceae bacterium]|nr:hypothetical protein [Burkholderiaceae bacterium]